ncbi:GPO family capsid scaffolding protein [Dechloromonas denitrificans]|uniref:GPO family capsid scaffolding protein n=1 Tax=Dechloromonas denitrificans TaxID=281362 RepID=UPI001CF927A4|nr:GPO family capsid scaffolding protein [Dechloromonas denitrificans]UCV02283.1 GPO family capsid scaffolding protein [Dechloromonas denitrificans]
MASKSKFFRVAVEGDTTDGRVIQRSWLEQIAKSFNPQTYGARIWLEHIRGVLPDSPFKAYGDVTAVKTEEVEINGVKKLGLFAQIDATPDLIAMNKARQKIYTSLEIDPNFAKTSCAYLMGLGVTDTPASLGTEMLQFSASAPSNPLAGRKLSPENLFTAAQEVSIEWEDEAKPAAGDTLFAKVKDLLGMGKKDTDGRFADQGNAVEIIALSQKGLLDELGSLKKQQADSLITIEKMSAAIKAAEEQYTALVEKLGKTPDGSKTRPVATGGDGQATTDC